MNSVFLQSTIRQRRESKSEAQEADSELENIIGRPPPSYFLPEYWDERYKKEKDIYDWYQKWDQLKHIITPEFISRDSALDVGCGSSTVPIGLINEGFQKVVGLDISKNVIDQNTERYPDVNGLEFVAGDVLSMKDLFEDNSFDVVFDKGTMDCLTSSPSTSKNVPIMMKEIMRVLKQNGIFIEVSYGTPKTRLFYLEDLKDQWIISEPKKIENPNEEGHFHYIYVAQKNPVITNNES